MVDKEPTKTHDSVFSCDFSGGGGVGGGGVGCQNLTGKKYTHTHFSVSCRISVVAGRLFGECRGPVNRDVPFRLSRNVVRSRNSSSGVTDANLCSASPIEFLWGVTLERSPSNSNLPQLQHSD